MVHNQENARQSPDPAHSSFFFGVGSDLGTRRSLNQILAWPGTHCLRMLRYPKNIRGSDTIVFCLVYLPFDLNTLSSLNPEVIGMDGSIFERDFLGSSKDVVMWIDEKLRTAWVRL
jgi:hypothetical protein